MMDSDNIRVSVSAIISDRYTLWGKLIFHPPLRWYRHDYYFISNGCFDRFNWKRISSFFVTFQSMFIAIYSHEIVHWIFMSKYGYYCILSTFYKTYNNSKYLLCLNIVQIIIYSYTYSTKKKKNYRYLFNKK